MKTTKETLKCYDDIAMDRFNSKYKQLDKKQKAWTKWMATQNAREHNERV